MPQPRFSRFGGQAMKDKYLALSVGVILLAGLFFVMGSVLVRKQLAEVERLDIQTRSTLGKLNSARIMEQQLSRFGSILTQSLTSDQAFSEDELKNFNQELEGLIRQNQLEKFLFDPAKKNSWLETGNKYPEPGMIETTFSFQLTGTFAQLGQFVSELEALDQVVKIRYLDVSPAPPEEPGLTEESEQAMDPGVGDLYRLAVEFSLLKVVKGSDYAAR